MNDHDIAICDEALVEEPYRLKIRSTERGMGINSRELKRNAILKVQLQRGLCVTGITY